MMTPGLKLRCVVIRVRTAAGDYGCRVDLSPGLFLIHAKNTSGKSTLVRSIAYALGLEGMWGPKQDVPLAHAVTHELDTGTGSVPVIASEVLLECENRNGDTITVRRSIVGGADRALVNLWTGAALTQPGEYRQQDYFVRQQGAATRAAGFHHRLAEFMGWELPLVPRISGGEVPLYMECIVPLMFVEQKHGWSSVQGRYPGYLGIREVGRRATEFVLALDVGDIERRRRALRDEELQLRERWTAAAMAATSLAHSVSGTIEGIPRQPLAIWPAPVTPRILVAEGTEWIPLADAIEKDAAELKRLEAEPIPTVGDAAPQLLEQLKEREQALASAEEAARAATGDAELEQSELAALRQRLAGIEEEFQKAKDAAKLVRLGASQAMAVSHGDCPTCGQTVTDVLLPQPTELVAMSVDDTISYLEDQRNIVSAMHAASERRVAEHEKVLQAIRSRLADLRAEVRALRTSLVADNRTPSLAAVEARVRLGTRIQHLRRVREAFDIHAAAFATLANEWRAMLAERALLPESELSSEDEAKLGALERVFKSHLKQFGFTSVPPESLEVSRDSYRPVHQGGFELDFDLSASDGVRVIWAYLLGLLEVARSHPTNHLGLLVFDEPRQQSAHGESLRQLLHVASHSSIAGQQVIVATSEDEELLTRYVSGLPHGFHAFPGRVLTLGGADMRPSRDDLR